jgi:hypothetical protein
MLPRIRALGYPAALVAQDGLEHLDIDWTAFDALFLGASTAWKLGPAAADLTARAREHGLTTHMGRVNSLRRLRYAASIGAQSVDGTYLAYGPQRNLPTLLRWLEQLNTTTLQRPGSERADDPQLPDQARPGRRSTATRTTNTAPAARSTTTGSVGT